VLFSDETPEIGNKVTATRWGLRIYWKRLQTTRSASPKRLVNANAKDVSIDRVKQLEQKKQLGRTAGLSWVEESRNETQNDLETRDKVFGGGGKKSGIQNKGEREKRREL